ncbi:hypothetical protein SAMD00023378_0071 [Ralstonia sp. NT80]|jgi:hypothetical protein|uniref:hypothetical protein n=1 Tax=Ralstonia sp. NT80 TaxID=1218247 RepID=UPI00073F3F89|nr:hypothetical protein [Ralstonia sp. NT80]GAQ26388.1 hypothetical protein SAMD00023378_0071 [Ralstonia sp. NT80]
MLASYRLIQFIPDRAFPAPVNVGLIAWTSKETRLRFLGFEIGSNSFDVAILRRAFGLPDPAEPVLLEWFRWFQDIATRRGSFAEIGIPLLEQLESRDYPFWANQAGEADIGAKELDALADDVFRRAVLALPLIRFANLEQAAIKCLAAAGLVVGQDGLIEDAEISLPKTSAGRALLSLTWFLDRAKEKAGFRIVDFEAIESAVGQHVADALNTFEVARSRELLRRDQCFVLHGPGLSDYPLYSELLGDATTLIEVSSPDAANRLRAALAIA